MLDVSKTGFVLELALFALALGGCCPYSVQPPTRPTARVEPPFATSSSESPAGIAELVKKAWATRDDRRFAEAFENLANQGRSEFSQNSIRLSADGRSVLVDAKRGSALLDASTGEPRMWLPTEGPDETARSWFVEGRPDDLVFWRGNYVRNELPSACVVVSVATGVERFRLPRCRIPASWIADNTMYAPPDPPTVPPFLIRGPTNPCDDDVLVPWAEAGAPPSPVTPVPKETPVLSYPWGCCRQEPKVDQEQPLVRELRPQTGMQIDDLAASPDGSAVAAVFSGPILGTVGLRSASGRWLSFVRGEVWDIRMKVLPAFSPDSRWVAVKSDTDGQAYGESRVLILDVRSGEVRHNFLGPCKFPKSFAWSSDSKLLAVGDEERSCVFELGKGLLWTKTFTKPEECFRCRKIPEFAMGGRVVIVRATEYMPGGAVLEVRSGRVLTSGKALGPFEETEGKLRVVIDLFADHPRIDTLDSSFVVQSRPPSSKELDHLLQDQENPVAVKYRDKLCVRDGYIFPSRFCAGQKPF